MKFHERLGYCYLANMKSKSNFIGVYTYVFNWRCFKKFVLFHLGNAIKKHVLTGLSMCTNRTKNKQIHSRWPAGEFQLIFQVKPQGWVILISKSLQKLWYNKQSCQTPFVNYVYCEMHYLYQIWGKDLFLHCFNALHNVGCFIKHCHFLFNKCFEV